jgi:hypothetical protein
MVKKNVILIIILLFATIFVAAQVPTNIEVIPPAPNAASLGVYGDIPVSSYTGTANVEIPLYTIKSNSLTLPVTLNYHPAGVKVAQEASWVGLGWSLNSGGVITRTVRGLDDFIQGSAYGFVTHPTLPPADNNNDPIMPVTGSGSPCDWSNDTSQAYVELNTGVFDPEPDLFYYNFGMFSGKMVYNPATQKFSTLNASDLSIEYSTSMEKWIIYTDEGTRYVFASAEISMDFSTSSELMEYDDHNGTTHFRAPGYNNNTPYVSTWYLDSIVGVAGDYIAFQYINNNTRSASRISKSQIFYHVARSLSEYRMLDFNYANQSVTDELFLSKIKTNDGLVIDFVTNDRTDIETLTASYLATSTTIKSQKLVEVNIKNELSTSPPKSWNFYYSYFNESVTPYFDNRRLKLDSLIFLSGTISNPPYKFSYNSNSLPPKTSKAIDHWGYSNAQTTNNYASNWGSNTHGSLIPTVLQPGGDSYTGANRTANETEAQSAVLNKIFYPTGGFTEFTYELNDYAQTVPPQPITVTRTIQATASQIPGDTINRNSQIVSFVLISPKLVTLSYNAYSPSHAKTCGSGMSNIINYTGLNASVACYLENYSHNPFEILKYNDWAITCSFPTQVKSKSIVLSAGTYYLNAITLALPDNLFRTMIRVSYLDTTGTAGSSTISIKGGGLRIKTIVSNSSQATTTKKFSYTLYDQSSSGRLLAPIKYFGRINTMGTGHFFGVTLNDFPTQDFSYGITLAYSSGITPMGSGANGNSIGYSRVVETTDENGANGKVINYYTNFTDIESDPGPLSSPNTLPNTPNVLVHNNGLLRRTEIFNSDSVLLKSIDNIYQKHTPSTFNVKGVKLFSFRHLLPDDPQFPDNGTVCSTPGPNLIKFYSNKGEWWRKVSDTTKTFANGLALVTYTNYEYDSINHMVNKTITINSKGDTLVSKTGYAHNSLTEILTTPTVITAMINKNMIGIPLKQEGLVNGVRKKGSIENYGANLLPLSTLAFEDTAFVPIAYFDNYSANRLVEFHQAYGMGAATLWAYKNSLQVITAKNINFYGIQTVVSSTLISMGYLGGYSDIDSLFTDIGNVTTNTQKTLLQTFITSIRASLINNECTITTYDPANGITSSTDINGRTIYYEHDFLGRLILIRDENNHVLKKICYNYSGKAENCML